MSTSARYTHLAAQLAGKAEKWTRHFKNETVFPIHFAFAMFEPESHINGDDGYDSGSDEDDTISTAKKQKPPPESKHVSFWTASLSAAIARVGGDTATFMATMQELVTHGLPTITKGARWPTPQSSYVKDMLTVADKIRKSRQDAFVAPHHVLLALVHAPDVESIILGAGLTYESLEKAILDIRGPIRVYRTKEGTCATSLDSLKSYCFDISALAENGDAVQAIDREDDCRRMIRVLSRRAKNTPCLVGDRGTGKTAIALDLARRIVQRETPLSLCGIVIKLNMPKLRASNNYKQRTSEVIDDLRRLKRNGDEIIIFIDDLELAARDDGMNLWIDLLNEGLIRCFGTSSRTGFTKYVQNNTLLQRQIVRIDIEEPSAASTLSILRGTRERFEKHHDVQIPDAALEAVVKLAKQYIRDRLLPDKAIDLLDEACAHVSVTRNFESSVESPADSSASVVILSVEVVAEVVAKWTKIPVSRLMSTEKQNLLRLEANLMASVVGQPEAVRAVANAIRLSRSGLANKSRPVASFMFAGSTGTGKTFLCKALAHQLFHSTDAMIRIDCSEYSESHNVARLIGSPPGYHSSENGGQLTEHLRKTPYTIVLLDELEKAHPKFLTIFLQVLDDGRLTDGMGNTVSFTDAIIIATSNIGAEHLRDVTGGTVPPEARKLMMKAIEDRLAPEFINRLDDIIIFRKLTHDNIGGIIDVRLKEIHERLASNKLSLTLSNAAKSHLVDMGYSPVYGARPLNRIIQQELLQPLSIMILSDQILEGEVVKIEFNRTKNKLAIHANHEGLDTSHCSAYLDANDDDVDQDRSLDKWL